MLLRASRPMAPCGAAPRVRVAGKEHRLGSTLAMVASTAGQWLTTAGRRSYGAAVHRRRHEAGALGRWRE